MVRRPVTAVVDEVHGSGPGQDVHGAPEDQDRGEHDDGGEVVLEVEVELVNVVVVHLGGLDENDGDEREERESQEVGDEVVVA